MGGCKEGFMEGSFRGPLEAPLCFSVKCNFVYWSQSRSTIDNQNPNQREPQESNYPIITLGVESSLTKPI